MRRMSITTTFLACCGIACGFTTTYAADPLLQWTFDEAAAGDQDALDSGVAPAENGMFLGGATRSTNTPLGASTASADLLTASEGYIEASDDSAFQSLEAITLTAWINLQADPPSEGSGNDRIAALQEAATFAGFPFNVNAPADGDDDIFTSDDFRLRMFIGGDFLFGFGQSTADIEGLGGE